jgi:hypothetical protein
VRLSPFRQHFQLSVRWTILPPNAFRWLQEGELLRGPYPIRCPTCRVLGSAPDAASAVPEQNVQNSAHEGGNGLPRPPNHQGIRGIGGHP